VTLVFLAMVLVGAGVLAWIIRQRPDEPDLPSERASEMGRAQAIERGNHSQMGPH